MKLRPILTIIAVLGVAALLFLPADIRAASTGRWTNIDAAIEHLPPAKPK